MEELIGFIRTRKKATLILALINIVVFVILSFVGNTQNANFLLLFGACYTPYVQMGEYYRLITSMFLHFGFMHLFYNMLCLILLGDVVERELGTLRYLLVYFAGGIAGNLLSCYVNIKQNFFPVSAGASGATFAITGALLVLALKNGGQIENMTQERILFMIIFSVLNGFKETGIDNAAHVGGLVAGGLITLILYKKRTGRSGWMNEYR